MKTLVWIVIAFPMTMFAQETKVSKYLSLTGEWCNENLVLHDAMEFVVSGPGRQDNSVIIDHYSLSAVPRARNE